jgi:3',5'-cyclic AMP phosphodiesterase CpdA
VAITGDITTFGRVDEFSRAFEWIGRIPHPLVVTPGNHDTPYVGLIARLAAPFARYESGLGPADQVAWSSAALSVVTVNTARGVQVRLNWSKGAVRASQTDHALQVLDARPPGALGVVVCHHPLVEMIGGPMTARVRGGEAAARRLCDAGVDLILTGHIHAPFAMAFPYGDGHTYAVGAGTLSLRERGTPAGFNLIDIDPDAVRVTAMAWTGSHFEAWRTWNLPRRRKAA